jgi:hypothetical protein
MLITRLVSVVCFLTDDLYANEEQGVRSLVPITRVRLNDIHFVEGVMLEMVICYMIRERKLGVWYDRVREFSYNADTYKLGTNLVPLF